MLIEVPDTIKECAVGDIRYLYVDSLYRIMKAGIIQGADIFHNQHVYIARIQVVPLAKIFLPVLTENGNSQIENIMFDDNALFLKPSLFRPSGWMNNALMRRFFRSTFNLFMTDPSGLNNISDTIARAAADRIASPHGLRVLRVTQDSGKSPAMETETFLAFDSTTGTIERGRRIYHEPTTGIAFSVSCALVDTGEK